MSESYTVEAILTAVDRSFSSTLTRAGSAIQTFSSNASKVTSNIGKGMIVAGAAISAVGKSSLSSFGDFQSGLNKAAIVAGGTSKDIKGLSDVANKMGKDYQFQQMKLLKLWLQWLKTEHQLEILKSNSQLLHKLQLLQGQI